MPQVSYKDSGVDISAADQAKRAMKSTLATSDNLNTYDVLRSDKLVFTKGAFEKVEARLSNKE